MMMGTTEDGYTWQGIDEPGRHARVHVSLAGTYELDDTVVDVSPWLRTVLGWIFLGGGNFIMYGEARRMTEDGAGL